MSILADVLVKHAAPLVDLSPEQATADTLDRGLADAVIVTGGATGQATSAERLKRVAAAAGSAPVLIGSGLTVELASALAPLADGAIVGSWVKRQGQVDAPVDRVRVDRLTEAVAGRWRQPSQ